MELFIPFMLFIMDVREDGTLSRHPMLYDSEQSCLQAGRELVEARVRTEGISARNLKVICEPIPPVEEFHELFDKLDQEPAARGSEN